MNSENSPTVYSAQTERCFRVRLPATWLGARRARHLAVERLRAWGRASEDAAQIIAELAGNAVVYGRVPARDFRLTLVERADGVLRIEVTDTRGERLPVVREAGAEDESGRGLLIVAVLADRWGVEVGPAPLKTVWAELAGAAPRGVGREAAPRPVVGGC